MKEKKTMKQKTIARINDKSITFQKVESFQFVRRENVQYMTDDERFCFSDWLRSGDLLNAEFTYTITDLEFRFDIRELVITGKTLTYYQHQTSILKNEIIEFNRVNNAVNSALNEIGCYMHSVDLKILISILFKRLNVVGGTLSLQNGNKFAFNHLSLKNTIEKLALALSDNNQE